MRTDSLPSTAPQISISQLEEAFATFNRVSTDLGSQYKELENKVIDLTEELAASRSARLKELTEKEQLAAKLSVLMAALPAGVISLNADGIIKEENPAAIKIIGKNIHDRSWQQALQSVNAAEITFNGEITLGTNRRININSNDYGDHGEKIILLNDVTESYRLNTLINREKRLTALGEMAARLAHQVRTPLSAAILYLSHLSAGAKQDNLSMGIINKILNRLRQIERLVEGMLSYIRGGINDYEEFCLKTLIRDVKTSVDLAVDNAEGQLDLYLPEYPCRMKGNREALFNALSNLIDNSIKAVTSKPRIVIELDHQQENYLIKVSDNGPGIDESIKEQVFDPFFSTRTNGTGLGLAVVLSAVKAHNGEVSIINNEKKGTQFQLLIPDNHKINNESSGIWGIHSQKNIIEQKQEVSNG